MHYVFLHKQALGMKFFEQLRDVILIYRLCTLPAKHLVFVELLMSIISVTWARTEAIVLIATY